MKALLRVVIILSLGSTTAALLAETSSAPTAVAAAAPSAVEVKRADKIVAALNLGDPAKVTRVRDLIARQYYDLSLIHGPRDQAIKAARATGGPKADVAAAIETARARAEAAQAKLHAEYLARLGAELTPDQIAAVKDGMTYGVLPLTFRVYQEMLPNLTADQKAQILAWLTEAREHAMDGSTSEEKHAWFGKYKGRINNFLAKAGYDMKAAEKNLGAQR